MVGLVVSVVFTAVAASTESYWCFFAPLQYVSVWRVTLFLDLLAQQSSAGPANTPVQ